MSKGSWKKKDDTAPVTVTQAPAINLGALMAGRSLDEAMSLKSEPGLPGNGDGAPPSREREILKSILEFDEECERLEKENAATAPADKYRVAEMSFTNGLRNGEPYPWPQAMSDYLNLHNQAGDKLFACYPAAERATFVFIWELPC